MSSPGSAGGRAVKRGPGKIRIQMELSPLTDIQNDTDRQRNTTKAGSDLSTPSVLLNSADILPDRRFDALIVAKRP